MKIRRLNEDTNDITLVIQECFMKFYEDEETEFEISYYDDDISINILYSFRSNFENFTDCLSYLEELKEVFLEIENCSKKLEYSSNYSVSEVTSYHDDEAFRITFTKNK